MLFYKPPFLMVDQVTVFPDHSDLEAFYYIVAVPELVVEQQQPAFWATAILPPASTTTGGAGQQAIGRALVSFDIETPLPADPENRLRKEIQKHYGRAPKRLIPAPLSSGKASLTVARPGAAEANKDFFVYEGHSPSLMGSNRAAFAIAAEGAEAQSLVAALSVGHLAAVVTYDLQFPGLAPSFEARMVVHWRTVYERFRERETMNAIFVAEEIDKTIEKLKESRAIEIEIKELDPEGAKAATRALFDELRSEVVKRLFETPRPSGDVPIEERIGRGVREVLTSLMPGVSHTLRTLNQNLLSDTVIDLREQQVKNYPFFPQSTLAGVLERAGGAAGRLVFVRMEDLPQRIEEAFVEMAPASERLGVRSVRLRVQATTPGRDVPLADESFTLSPKAPERKSLRFRRLGSEEPSLRFQAEMSLDPAVAPAGKERLLFDWKPAKGNRVWFDPEEFLDVAEVRIEIDDAAVLDTSTVRMDIEAICAGETTPFRKATLGFSKTALSQTFSVVVPDGKTVAFRGTEIFSRLGESDFVRAAAIKGSIHRVMNPFGQAWSMEVHAVSTWIDTTALFVEFRVWDVLRKLFLLGEQQFNKAAASATFRFSTSLDTPKKAEARVTRVAPDGRIVRGPWKDLAGPVVAVSDDVRAERRIRATLAAPQFVKAGVKKVFVDLEYPEDGTSPVAAADPPLEFARDGATADWTHAFPDPTRPFYRYRVRAKGENGERFTGPWVRSGADDVSVTLPEVPW